MTDVGNKSNYHMVPSLIGGGSFKNLATVKSCLMVAVPMALVLVFYDDLFGI